MQTFIPYHSSNGHIVTLYGRLFFVVTSRSRKGIDHFVDLEESEEWKARFLCTCEAFKWGTRPCRHIAACFEAMSYWSGVPGDIVEEWIDRMMFLLNMGHSLEEAIHSPLITSIHPPESKPEPPARKVRQYTINAHETPTTDPKRKKRRLPARLHRDAAGSPN